MRISHLSSFVTPRFVGLALLALACLVSAGSVASAATVSWSGSGGDDLWSNPANWTGGLLPTALDDVVIDVPGDTTVQMDVANTTVRSVQCEESLLIQNGPFTVTNGMSVVNGLFAVKSPFALVASGPSTVFSANGTVTNLWTVQAMDGARVVLPTMQSLAIGPGFPYGDWTASGAGSAIVLANLTQLEVQAGYLFRMNADSGGRIEAPRLAVPYGSLQVSCQGTGSLVDFSGFDGLWAQGFNGGNGISLSAGSGGTVLIPNVTAMEQMILNLNNDANVDLDQLRSFSGSLNLDHRTNGFSSLTNFSGSISASYARLDWTNFTELQSPNGNLRITAYNDSVIDLSNVTNAVVDPSFRFDVVSQYGGRIDLRSLRQPTGSLNVESRLEGGGVVDLSGFTGLWDGKGSSLRVENGGSVLIPNVTALLDVSLTLDGGSFVPIAQLGSIVGGNIGLTARTNGFDGLTNFSANLSAANSRLDLTNLTVLYITNAGNNVSFSASQGSFIDLSRVTNVVTIPGRSLGLGTYDNSRIDLSGLPASDTQLGAVAFGGLIDLSGLSGSWVVGDGNGTLDAFSGGTIAIPNVTAIKGISLRVSGDGGLDLSRIESIVDGSISLTDCTNDLAALTNFSGSLAANNAELILTNLTALYVTNRNNYFFTVERGGILNLSNVTNFVAAPNSGVANFDVSRGGGRIDLSGMTVPGLSDVDLKLSFNVAGQNAVVDLSGLHGVWKCNSVGGKSVSSDGSLLIPNVTALDGISLNINGGRVPLSQLHSVVDGYLTLGQRTNVFSSLTNFQGTMICNPLGRAEFPALTQLGVTNGPVQFTAPGGYIDLSQVTNAIVTTHALNVSASSGGHVDLSNLETIVAGNVQVNASGADAVVDLSGLTGFFSDSNEGRFSTSSGGVILLNPDAMLISGVAFDFQSNPGGPVPPFMAGARELVLYGQPWRSYRVEARNPAEAGSPWQSYLPRVALTDSLLSLGARPPRNLILRVYSFVADPPEVDIRRGASGTLEAILFGKPESTYRLETTEDLGDSGWQETSTTTLTNSFFIVPGIAPTNTVRCYRGRQL